MKCITDIVENAFADNMDVDEIAGVAACLASAVCEVQLQLEKGESPMLMEQMVIAAFKDNMG